MKEELFKDLLDSVEEGGKILRGEVPPAVSAAVPASPERTVMQFLSVLEIDGKAFGGYVPQLHVTAVGSSLEEVRTLLRQGIALELEHESQEPRYASFESLPSDVREAFSDAQIQVEFLEPEPMNPVSRQLAQAMEELGLTPAELARRMGSSPSTVRRMTNPFYWDHRLSTLCKAAEAMGKDIRLGLV